jgi:hypothetical protein
MQEYIHCPETNAPHFSSVYFYHNCTFPILFPVILERYSCILGGIKNWLLFPSYVSRSTKNLFWSFRPSCVNIFSQTFCMVYIGTNFKLDLCQTWSKFFQYGPIQRVYMPLILSMAEEPIHLQVFKHRKRF